MADNIEKHAVSEYNLTSISAPITHLDAESNLSPVIDCYSTAIPLHFVASFLLSKTSIFAPPNISINTLNHLQLCIILTTIH